MNFKDWLAGIPHTFQTDPLWTVGAYRLALFSADVAWKDATKLMQDLRARALSSQLYDALGSIDTDNYMGCVSPTSALATFLEPPVPFD